MTNPIAIISRYTLHPVEPDSTFEELGLDQISAAGIANRIETEFLCDIPDREVERWTCVADVVRTVEKYAPASRTGPDQSARINSLVKE